jgi:diguanylate cyclase (GGDEF)-like protein
LPSTGSDGSFVLFNPYVTHSDNLVVKEQCDSMLKEHPEWVQTYGKLTVIPVDQSLCVYGPRRHMLAILNLSITLDEQLRLEMMNGYFLALLDANIEPSHPLVSAWAPPWVHRKVFDFLGTHWAINIYPSKAYVEASIKRVFLVFCLTFVGGLGLFGWWFLRRRVRASGPDSHYVEHLKQLALFDGVTNLPNRRHCVDYLGRTLNRAKRHHRGFSVCFMDCNDFKGINDTYGHHVGDLVLRHIADEVSLVIRRHDFFARYAGDEFCLILEETATDASIKMVLDKILNVISNPIFVGEASIVVGMSVGVAVYPEAGESTDVLLKHADMAMYDSKRRQEAYVIYRPELPL